MYFLTILCMYKMYEIKPIYYSILFLFFLYCQSTSDCRVSGWDGRSFSRARLANLETLAMDGVPVTATPPVASVRMPYTIAFAGLKNCERKEHIYFLMLNTYSILFLCALLHLHLLLPEPWPLSLSLPWCSPLLWLGGCGCWPHGGRETHPGWLSLYTHLSWFWHCTSSTPSNHDCAKQRTWTWTKEKRKLLQGTVGNIEILIFFRSW